MSETVAMETEAEKPWLVWSWRYGTLDVDGHDDRESAVKAAVYVGDYGEASFSHVEGPDGIVPQEVIDAAEAERWEQQRVEDDARSKPTHRLLLRVADGSDTAAIGYYGSEAAAAADRERLALRFGDRLRVEKLR